MTTKPLKGNGLVSFSTPHMKLDVALHRRGHEWFIVYPRAYGMAEGNKLVGQISSPEEASPPTGRSNATHDPPSSTLDLNPRFWLREGRDFGHGCGNEMLEAEDLLRAEPAVLKDSGLKRTRKVANAKRGWGKEGSERECTERLVEVLIKEEGLCHRCATCGQWETCYADSVRHEKVGENKDGRPVYWCRNCSRAPRRWDRYWWCEPENLPFDVYFYYRMEHVKTVRQE